MNPHNLIVNDVPFITISKNGKVHHFKNLTSEVLPDNSKSNKIKKMIS